MTLALSSFIDGLAVCLFSKQADTRADKLTSKQATAVLSAVLVLQLAACGGPPRAKPAALESISTTESDIQAAIQSAAVDWSVDTGESSRRDAVKLSPYVSDEFVFAIDAKGKLSAFNRETGATDWTIDLEQNITSGVSGDEDNLYVASGNGEVFAISQSIGGILWTSDVSSEVIAAPVAGPDYVVVRSLDGKVYALEKNSGERRWIYTYSVPALSIHGNGRPTVVADGVLVGLDNGRLVALRAVDGRVFWEVSLGDNSGRSEVEKLSDLDADVQIFDPYIYAVNYQGNVAQVDAAQGSAIWSSEVSSVAGLAVTEQLVIVTDEFDAVRAFDRSNGEPLWSQESLANRRLTGPIATDSDVIAIGDVQGYLHFLSSQDGSIVGRLQTGVGAIAGRPVLRDEKIYLQGRTGKVAAVDITP